MFSVLGAEDRVVRAARSCAGSASASSKFVDGGFAQLGIGRVRHAAGGDDLVAQRALGAERELVLGGLAVDEEVRAARRLGGGVGAGAVALLADDEQQAEVAHARASSASAALIMDGDDALGVAGAASPDVLVVLARGEERRHGIDVSGERDSRLAPVREDVEALRGSTSMRSTAAVLRGEGAQILEEVIRRRAPRCR